MECFCERDSLQQKAFQKTCLGLFLWILHSWCFICSRRSSRWSYQLPFNSWPSF